MYRINVTAARLSKRSVPKTDLMPNNLKMTESMGTLCSLVMLFIIYEMGGRKEQMYIGLKKKQHRIKTIK